MSSIDVLTPVSKIFEKDEYVSQIEPNKLSTISNGLTVKAFCNKWTVSTLKRDSDLDDTEVELIDECLAQYGLCLDMSTKEIDKYQKKTRSLSNASLSREEKIILKNNKEKEMKTKTKIKTKEIRIPMNGITSSAPDNPTIDDEKFFRFMMMYKKETGSSVKESCEAINEFFEFRKKSNKTVDIVKVDNVKVDDAEVEEPCVNSEQQKDDVTIREKIIFAINAIPLFFTTEDIISVIRKRYGDFDDDNYFYNITREIFKDYCSMVQADFGPIASSRTNSRPYNVYVLKRNITCDVTYERYYDWLFDKNNTFKTLCELKRDFTRMEFFKKYREVVNCQDSKATVFYHLLKAGKIKQISDDKYCMGSLLSGPVVFKS